MYIDWSEVAGRIGALEIDESGLQDLIDAAVNIVRQALQDFMQELEDMIGQIPEEDPEPERKKTYNGRGSRVFPIQRRMLLPWYTSGFR